MLYLNSIENAEASPTEKKYAICHEEIPSMLHIPELAPSKELLTRWQSNTMDWEEFRDQFTDEMRAEYRKKESRLKGLIKYTLESDVTLHSPEPSGEQTYRAILEGIINAILADKGQTDRVINLARKPVEEAQPQEDIADLFGNVLHELNLTKSDNTRLLIENAELKKDIQSFETESHNKGKENDELKKRIDQLEEQINTHEATIDDLRQTLLEKDRELKEQINGHEATIDDFRRTLSEKEKIISNQKREIQSLQSESRQKNRDIAQLEEINTHPKIRDIAVEAAGDDPEFKKFNIDEYLPIALEEWLETYLNQALGRRNVNLYNLIDNHIDFEEEKLNPDELDYSDRDLVYVIKTQRNVLAHPGEMNKNTSMARVLCCFFAAALLPSKRPKPKQPAFR